MSAGSSCWGLSAYPVSSEYRSRLERQRGVPIEISVLSELRNAGVWQLIARLRAVRAVNGFVLMEAPASTPLLALLRVLLALTRCRQLAVIDHESNVEPLDRGAVVIDVVRLIVGSVRGLAAATRCRIELTWLHRQRPLRPAVVEIQRIVYLKTNLWFGVKAGGSVGHVAGVANALANRCEHIDLLSVEQPPLLAPAVQVHVISSPGTFGFPFELNYYTYQQLFVRQAKRVCLDAKPSLVYQRLSLANYSGVTVARDLEIPLVVEYNGSEVWVSKHWGRALHFPGLAAAAEDAMLRHADLIVTVSEVLGDELRQRGISRERILIHPNCVDPDRFDPAQFSSEDRRALLARYGVDPSSVVCGFIGTFGMWHGVLVLAEAIREMAEAKTTWLEDKRVHFLLVGDGLLMPQVRAIIGAPHVARFATLVGLVEQDQAAGYLAACDLLLSPHVPNADGSRFFGSPTKLFEYMAMGRAIVASDLDQIGEVLARSLRPWDLPSTCDRITVADRVAVLIEPGNRQQLVEAIGYLVERPACRQQLGENARREVLARYTWERNVDELLRQLRMLQKVG